MKWLKHVNFYWFFSLIAIALLLVYNFGRTLLGWEQWIVLDILFAIVLLVLFLITLVFIWDSVYSAIRLSKFDNQPIRDSSIELEDDEKINYDEDEDLEDDYNDDYDLGYKDGYNQAKRDVSKDDISETDWVNQMYDEHHITENEAIRIPNNLIDK